MHLTSTYIEQQSYKEKIEKFTIILGDLTYCCHSLIEDTAFRTRRHPQKKISKDMKNLNNVSSKFDSTSRYIVTILQNFKLQIIFKHTWNIFKTDHIVL